MNPELTGSRLCPPPQKTGRHGVPVGCVYIRTSWRASCLQSNNCERQTTCDSVKTGSSNANAAQTCKFFCTHICRRIGSATGLQDYVGILSPAASILSIHACSSRPMTTVRADHRRPTNLQTAPNPWAAYASCNSLPPDARRRCYQSAMMQRRRSPEQLAAIRLSSSAHPGSGEQRRQDVAEHLPE